MPTQSGEKGSKKTEKKMTETELRKERALVKVPHPQLNFTDKHHIIIAKLKRGELWALNHLSVAEKSSITPLFEMWPPVIPRPPKQKPGQKPTPAKPPKSLFQHSHDLFKLVQDEWHALPCFLDTRYVPKGGIPTAAAVKTIFDAARSLSLPCVPVTSPRFTQTFQAEIAKVIAQDGRGVMFRLQVEDFTNPSLLPSYLSALQTLLKVSSEQVDMLIDLRHRPAQAEVNQLGTSFLGYLPNPNSWRTLTLASGCFPSSITDWDYAKWIPISRSDWLGWRDVRTTREKGKLRQASFGDYGIRCGGEPLTVARRPDPNLRYSTDLTILTRKGTKDDGQMKAICADLIKKTEYFGQTFSRGDLEIALRAAAPGSPNNGQAEQWIQWCTNHHLALTASQIQSLP
jgi:hypothetical protein